MTPQQIMEIARRKKQEFFAGQMTIVAFERWCKEHRICQACLCAPNAHVYHHRPKPLALYADLYSEGTDVGT